MSITYLAEPPVEPPAEAAGATPSGPRRVGGGLLDPKTLLTSLPGAFTKLDPRTLWKNPVMFLVEVGSVFTTVLAVGDPSTFAWLITGWLWLTVLFANLAEAVAEGRGKAQADALRRAKTDTLARRLVDRANLTGPEEIRGRAPAATGRPRCLHGGRHDPR